MKKRGFGGLRKSLRHSTSDFFESPNAEKNWEKLQRIEDQRRTLLRRTTEPTYRILFSIQGTFWTVLFRDPLVYVTLIVYAFNRFQFQARGPESVLVVDTGSIAAVGALMTFFLVYFHAQYSNRFDKLYLSSTACQARIFDISLIAKSALPRERASRLIRYMNAAHVSGYVGLSKVYSTNEFFSQINRKFQLVTVQEFMRLSFIDGSAKYREALVWCMVEVEDARQEGIIGEFTAQDIRQKIMDFRAHFADMYDLDDQPILFYYIHFIHFLSAFYLPLMAISVASHVALLGEDACWLNEVIGVAAVFLQVIFVVGLRILALIMQHPYGGELENLSVLTYIVDAIEGSMRMLKARKREPLSADVEDGLSDCRETLGDAWEDYSQSDLFDTVESSDLSIVLLDDSDFSSRHDSAASNLTIFNAEVQGPV